MSEPLARVISVGESAAPVRDDRAAAGADLAGHGEHRPRRQLSEDYEPPGSRVSGGNSEVPSESTEAPSESTEFPGCVVSPQETTVLSADEVRRITLYSQGFIGAGAKRGGVTGVVRRVSAVQLDPISVLARSHELVAYARLGPVGRRAVEEAYWPARKPAAFEYWAHAACILPIADW